MCSCSQMLDDRRIKKLFGALKIQKSFGFEVETRRKECGMLSSVSIKVPDPLI